jgi:hypothetical protein
MLPGAEVQKAYLSWSWETGGTLLKPSKRPVLVFPPRFFPPAPQLASPLCPATQTTRVLGALAALLMRAFFPVPLITLQHSP